MLFSAKCGSIKLFHSHIVSYFPRLIQFPTPDVVLRIKSQYSTSGHELQTKIKPNDEVLFESVNGKGIITLNRPKLLHTLTLSMVNAIQVFLRDSENSQQFVIIKSSGGKAFCAGGDMRFVVESVRAKKCSYEDGFRVTYGVCGLVGNLRIPYIALMGGITMGGGVGLSVHGKYRVATENTVFAMPENRIGLFPDVGMSYFLPRLPGKLGLYLALTGERLVGGDVFRTGIATHACDGSNIAALERDLIGLNYRSPQDIEKVLMKYHASSRLAQEPLSISHTCIAKINTIFSGNTVEEILERLQTEIKSGTEKVWATSALDSLSKMSPTSLKIAFRLMHEGKTGRNLDEALQRDLTVSLHRSQHHDFAEGVRSLLIDKDNNPTWKPNRLEDVSDETVDKYFQPAHYVADLFAK